MFAAGLSFPVTGSRCRLRAAAWTARAGTGTGGWEPGGAPGVAGKCIKGRGYKVSARGYRDLGIGANNLEMGASRVGIGGNNLEMGASRAGMGANNLEMGASRAGMGANNLEMGASRVGIGGNNLEMGARRVGIGGNNLEMGASRVGIGGNNLEMGARRVGIGGNNLEMGARRVGIGANNLEMGASRVGIGGNNLEMGARRVGIGAKSLVMGSRNLAADAWGLTHRRDITAVSPVGHLGQQACGKLNGVAGRSWNAGQRVWGSVISPRGLDWSRSWTFLSVSPGTGQAWRTLGFREHHLWSIANLGHLGRGLGTRPLGTTVPQDVLLFRHERERFFRLLGLFCVAQFLFWIYLAHFAFTSLKDTGYEETVLVGDRASNLPTIEGVSLNLGSNKWRFGFTTSCLTVGCLILTAGYIFARRSVHSVLLHRGGQQVTFSSYLPLGGTRSFVVPLSDVSCVAHRSQVPSVIPVKVKGHHFYYLLDKQGQFYNAKLFDITVGAYRKL